MRLSQLSISNYRSVKSIKQLRIEPLQAFVGENDAGKSNILRALDCFLGTGAGGVDKDDFNDPTSPIVIEAEFTGLSPTEKHRLRPYLIGDKLILQKRITLTTDPKSAKVKASSEYHGYKADPKDWWLSIDKIVEKYGPRPKWAEIAEQHGLTGYVQGDDGKVSKPTYQAGLDRYLAQVSVEYDEPEIGKTQALGIQQNLLSALPDFYLLPAITDYTDEIDTRSSTSVFRRLMGDLAERFISTDPQYVEVTKALDRLHELLNVGGNGTTARLQSLIGIETKLKDTIARLMPSVASVRIGVDIDEPKHIFAKGVNIKIHDGVLTDVLDKGNGMQRCLVFSLLQLLMESARSRRENRPIILGIEEPELYIHPQAQRLIFNVLKEFAGIQADDGKLTGTDQVIYTTHSPAFIDVARYEQIGCVRKMSVEDGTIVMQCNRGVLGSPEERRGFKLLTSFSLRHNELFFARYAILVEGVEDEIAVVACGRKLRKFIELPDELRLSIVVTGNKEQIPKFQKILNAFGFQYSVLLELDGRPEGEGTNAAIIGLAGKNVISKLPETLEHSLGLQDHFRDVFEAQTFLADPANISIALETTIARLFPSDVVTDVQIEPAEAIVQPEPSVLTE